MDTHERVQLITSGQIRGLVASFAQGIPLDLPSDVAQKWIGLPQQIWAKILNRGPDYFCEMTVEIEVALLSQWQRFYHDFFNMDVDLSQIHIPERKPGFDRLIIIAQSLTPNRIIEAMRRQGIKCSLYTDDLDSVLDWTKEERNPKDGAYAIWVRDCQEADEELKGLSANGIKAKGLTTETLTERLIHEAKYHSEANCHLDQNNITLCSGSRHGSGGVPDVDWGGVRLFVGWFSPGFSDGVLRARQVVRS